MGLFDVFNTSAQTAAANDQIKGLTTGYTGANNLISAGSDALKTQYGAALTPLQTTFNNAATGTGQQGYQAYADASGANGPEGLARAKATFQQTPGLQYGLDQAIGGNDRLAASRGMLGSGNTDADSVRLASDYGNQKYGQYVQGLSPYNAVPGQMTAAATGIAGVNTGLGDKLNQNTTNLADLFNKANIGAGNANANADLANLTASGNILKAGMSAASMLAGGIGGGGGMFSPSMWNSSLPSGSLTGV